MKKNIKKYLFLILSFKKISGKIDTTIYRKTTVKAKCLNYSIINQNVTRSIKAV